MVYLEDNGGNAGQYLTADIFISKLLTSITSTIPFSPTFHSAVLPYEFDLVPSSITTLPLTLQAESLINYTVGGVTVTPGVQYNHPLQTAANSIPVRVFARNLDSTLYLVSIFRAPTRDTARGRFHLQRLLAWSSLPN